MNLVNKPLVEAILELRWTLPVEHGPGVRSDPNYSVLPGLYWNAVRDAYPFREELPAASVPAEMIPHQPQHRFRAEDAGWPLVQIGPGILTVNDTHGYTWKDYRKRSLEAVKALGSVYPDADAFRVMQLALTYQDAHRFDYRTGSVLEYLKQYLHAGLSLPRSLFSGTAVDDKPLTSDWSISFAANKPSGTVSLRFVTGYLNQTEPVVITEAKVLSNATQVPELPAGFELWLEDAHDLAHDWFFKLIKGKLLQAYEGKEG